MLNDRKEFFFVNIESEKKIIIILVNYNGSRDTIECIKSIRKDSSFYDILVIDNCSTDSSVEYLKSFQQQLNFNLIISNENKGFSAGNNIGIKYAQQYNYDYYLLLNNDTIVTNGFIENLINGFSSFKNCGVTTAKINYYDEPNRIWYDGGSTNLRVFRTEHWNYNQLDNYSTEDNQLVTFISGCCMCISKDVINKVGYLNEEFFLYEEDAEYCVRILKHGYSMVYVPNSLIYHKVSSSTGKGSFLSQYYIIRNKYSLIKYQFEGLDKFKSYTYNTFQMLFRCLKREMSFSCYFKALNAFISGEKGKIEENRI